MSKRLVHVGALNVVRRCGFSALKYQGLPVVTAPGHSAFDSTLEVLLVSVTLTVLLLPILLDF